jgi:hypothetical protein
MAPHFLTIPPELRILICKFALTDPEHVNFREDERKDWRLCYQVTTREDIERVKKDKEFARTASCLNDSCTQSPPTPSKAKPLTVAS